jgi:predicted Fe-Mo cluster-binding NifX family protein
MKICVTATAVNRDAQIIPQFGGCSCFILADFENMLFEAIHNMAADVSGGVGIQATQTIANTDVNLLIAGKV